jgi:S-DNA-T family DNA segregation ATPase FtsK/SpoIIIE
MRPELPFLVRSGWGIRLLLLTVVTAFIVVLVIWWNETIERTGYGFVPAGLWVACLSLSLRFRPRKTLSRWRGWLGGIFLVAATFGILSLIQDQWGLTKATYMGGEWGELLGGYPLLYGALKIFGLLTLALLTIAPRLTTKVYRGVGEEFFRFIWLIVFVLLRGVVLVARYIRDRTPTFGDVFAPILRPVRLSAAAIPRKLSLRNRTPGWNQVTAKKESRPTKRVGSPTEDISTPTASRSEPSPAFERKAPRGKGPEELPSETLEGAPQETANWVLPPEGLLNSLPSQPTPKEELRDMSARIERTLAEHGLEVKVETVRPGPRVILFGLAPGFVRRQRNGKPVEDTARVKVDSIMAREKDLALALKTSSIRLWSPIPGEDAIGIEVPNPRPNMVSLRAIVENDSFDRIRASKGLPMALGEGTSGEPLAIDLKEMPHLLIAGATGSGKSVCINSLVSSLILTNNPQDLRMLMVDPKRVELTPYNGIPHLLMPVIVDAEKAVQAFGSVLNEMFRRYKSMEEMGTRNVDSYNRKADDPLPHIVIIVDELADLMMTAAYEVEQSLVRLAQLGRATGIHLILATQRPSVNVMTGLMKANIPARIAFAVASQVDSRVILDGAGAEKLLGKGDMLFQSPSEIKPQRIQGAYVSEKEIERLVLYWKSQHGPISRFFLRSDSAPLPEEPAVSTSDDGADGAESQEDRILERARGVASRYKRLSPAVLQRRLRIGYAKAIQIIEQLEEEGTVAPGDPGTSRLVLINGNGEPS